jgi:hypothetical protein
MSREQLDLLLVASGSPGAMSGVTGENDPKIQESAMMNANINTTDGEPLSRLNMTTDETHAESKNEQGSGTNSEDIHRQLLPDDAAAATGLPLQHVEESHAVVRVEERGETADSSLTADNRVKDKSAE